MLRNKYFSLLITSIDVSIVNKNFMYYSDVIMIYLIWNDIIEKLYISALHIDILQKCNLLLENIVGIYKIDFLFNTS